MLPLVDKFFWYHWQDLLLSLCNKKEKNKPSFGKGPPFMKKRGVFSYFLLIKEKTTPNATLLGKHGDFSYFYI